jgi:hypothetical protein
MGNIGRMKDKSKETKRRGERERKNYCLDFSNTLLLLK